MCCLYEGFPVLCNAGFPFTAKETLLTGDVRGGMGNSECAGRKKNVQVGLKLVWKCRSHKKEKKQQLENKKMTAFKSRETSVSKSRQQFSGIVTEDSSTRFSFSVKSHRWAETALLPLTTNTNFGHHDSDNAHRRKQGMFSTVRKPAPSSRLMQCQYTSLKDKNLHCEIVRAETLAQTTA